MKKLLLIVFVAIATTALAQYTYEGQKNSEGLPNGEGVMTWKDTRFEGTFRNGDPVKGTYYWLNENGWWAKTTGTFITKKHPKGQLQSSDVLEHGYVEKFKCGEYGFVFHGNKKNGLCDGYGEIIYYTAYYAHGTVKAGNRKMTREPDTTRLARPVKATASICAAIAAEAEKEESRSDNDT